MIKLYLPIEPVPKGRPRITRTGHVYTPQKTKDFEQSVKHLAALSMHENKHKPLSGVVSVRGYFFVKKPKKPKDIYPSGRPDLDNLIKSLFDALNGTVWEDDSQICACGFAKVYSETPSITLFAEEGFTYLDWQAK